MSAELPADRRDLYKDIDVMDAAVDELGKGCKRRGDVEMDEVLRGSWAVLKLAVVAHIEASSLALAERGEGWQPIAEHDGGDGTWVFWVVPKSPDEAFVDTSGNPIFSDAKPHLHRGRFGSWGSLMKATHFRHEFPAPASGRGV